MLDSHSADGWTVVSIVPAGTEIVAYLSRPRTGTDEPAASAPTATSAPTAASAGWALQPESASGPATTSTPAPTPDPAPAAAAAPAGWYADPSGRFELRYWDGGTWTEHVSRRGQQYTDPPVA